MDRGSSRRPRGRRHADARQASRPEWIGGRRSPPFFVTDAGEPRRLELVLWLEQPSGHLVGEAVVVPDEIPGAVGRALEAALERPLVGPRRRPSRIRVGDAALAAEVRAVVGEEIPVAVAPTPELDEVLAALVEAMPEEDQETYLEGGRVPMEAVAELFAAARILRPLAPWKRATDDRVLRVDVPALGVDGACLSIIGYLGESLGFLLFPSLAGYAAFARAAAEQASGAGMPVDFGTGWLALCFESEEELPVGMRGEVAAHGWPVAAADAYPVVERYDSDGASRPLVERDYRIAAACATSLAAFFAQHGDLFAGAAFEPVCESYFDADDLEVRFTLPYEAFPLFDVASGASVATPAAHASRGRPRRNDPCPCGSGRKYKRCCLGRDEAARRSREQEPGSSADGSAPAHERDEVLVRELSEYALRRFGSGAWCFAADFEDAEAASQLAWPWSVYGFHVQGRPVVDWFLEERGRKLGAEDRAWLEEQRLAWLSVWEVIAVEPGTSLTLRDLLSHEQRLVREASGSRVLVGRDAILGRVVDCAGLSVLCGVHPRPLPPFEVADLVRRARGRLRRRGAVPVERLREEAFGRYLIHRWEEAVAALDAQRAIPPRLQNTDGDPFLLTTDHFDIAPGAADAIAARLAAFPDVQVERSRDGPPAWVFLRPGNPMHAGWENTVIGQASVARTGLRVETNSRRRADELRARLEEACGEAIRHRSREHADPLSSRSPVVAPREARPQLEPPSPETAELVLEVKRRHYADWPDQPIPMLDGRTPREAVRTKQGRLAVDVLLKDIENRERRSAGSSAFDVSGLRRELGLA